ncbi:hypothetical protein H3C65_03800 [Patescibacteria group bacterium]|nr:hypothetical protein [Patescibacteria group bacterium]
MTREEAFNRLELPQGTDLSEIRRQFANMHNDYRMRIDNAPTPRLKQLFEQQLEDIKEAYTFLNDSDNINDTDSLPRTKRTYEEQLQPPLQNTEDNQGGLDEAYLFFGIKQGEDTARINNSIKKTLEDLQKQAGQQVLPAAKMIYEKELSKGNHFKELIFQEQERITALQRELEMQKEQERIAKEKAEQERIAGEKADRERIAKEKAEQERIAKVNAEQERIAREKAALEQKAKEEKIKAEDNAQLKQQEKGSQQIAEVKKEESNKSSNKWVFFLWALLLIGLGFGVYHFTNREHSDDTSIFTEDGLYGFMKGKDIVIPARFESVESFQDGRAKVEVNDSTFYINESGKMIELLGVNVPVESESQTEPEPESQEKAVPPANDTPVPNINVDLEKDEAAWKIAGQANNVAAYKSYLQSYPKGRHAQTARGKIKLLEQKQNEVPIDMDQYNKDLQWAKNMIVVDGCEGCRENPTCKSKVIDRLKNALKANPSGKEAQNLLNCLTR